MVRSLADRTFQPRRLRRPDRHQGGGVGGQGPAPARGELLGAEPRADGGTPADARGCGAAKDTND